MRIVVAAIAVLATLSPLFAAETIPCIVINGKAYAPAVLLGGGNDLGHTRTMAGQQFIWIREYAEAVGCELVWDGGLRLRRNGAEVAAFSLQPADRYWSSDELQTACPVVWRAAEGQIAPHVNSHPQQVRSNAAQERAMATHALKTSIISAAQAAVRKELPNPTTAVFSGEGVHSPTVSEPGADYAGTIYALYGEMLGVMGVHPSEGDRAFLVIGNLYAQNRFGATVLFYYFADVLTDAEGNVKYALTSKVWEKGQ